MKHGVIEILEAAYRVELPEPEWIDGVLSACAPLLEFGMGTYGYLFDVAEAQVKVGELRSLPRALEMENAMRSMVAGLPREYVERVWLHLPFGLASDVAGTEEILASNAAPYRDVLAINGFDPTGYGFWVGTPLAKRGTLTASMKQRWTRVAAHLAASYRVRRALAGAKDATRGADAIADPSGAIVHAEGDARDEPARTALRDAVLAIDRARTIAGREAGDDSLASWRGLVDARWSLIDHFDADGRRFVVARSNEAHRGSIADLSARERQVLAFIALDHSTKVTAYELGLAETTVRVLLMRAIRKLGVHTRAEAVARFRAEAPSE